MWHLVTTLLVYQTCASAQYYRKPSPTIIPKYVISTQPESEVYHPYNEGEQRVVYEDPYIPPAYAPIATGANHAIPINQNYNALLFQNPTFETRVKGLQGTNLPPLGYYMRATSIRGAPTLFSTADDYTLHSMYDPSGQNFVDLDSPLPMIEPRNSMESESTSYFDDLELIDNFGSYLLKRTQFDPLESPAVNGPAYQYNALLAVLVALARVIRNSCEDFDAVYDKVYHATVNTYYKYGLANADRVTSMIEDYIKKGNAHIPKIRKLRDEICETEMFCSTAVDNRIKASPLLYVKELETIEALAYLARTFYPYIEEFNQAAQKGTVLTYLQKSQLRLKDYIMHVINSVEHISDKPIHCES